MSDKLNSIYNTGCAPRNVFMVWGTLAIVSAVVALVQIMRKKGSRGLPENVTLTELVIALVVSVALVVIVSYILKALCSSETGWVIGFVVVAVLVILTSYGCADMYSEYITKQEVRAIRRVKELKVKEIVPYLKSKITRRAAAAPAAAPVTPAPVAVAAAPAAAPVQLSSTSSDNSMSLPLRTATSS